MAWRRANQPGGPNAGSVFTNPPGDSAGRLIDAAGGKGRRRGTAAVSTKHANFIQADDGGRADDVPRADARGAGPGPRPRRRPTCTRRPAWSASTPTLDLRSRVDGVRHHATLERPAAHIDPRIRARRIEVQRGMGRRRLQRLVDVGLVLAVAAGFAVALRSPLLDVDAVRVAGQRAHRRAELVVERAGIARATS